MSTTLYQRSKNYYLGSEKKVSRNIFSLHNGIITVESDEGKGSKFVMSLPVDIDGHPACCFIIFLAPNIASRVTAAAAVR